MPGGRPNRIGQPSMPKRRSTPSTKPAHLSSAPRLRQLPIDGAIATLKQQYSDTILIGGPPCQAYSLVGRVRSRGKVGYVPEEDARHYLFREYIRVLDELRPAAFVMENVKGRPSCRAKICVSLAM